MTEVPAAGSIAAREAVDAATDSFGMALARGVAECVRERLHRLTVQDRVPVAVQQAMELAQRRRAVVVEQSEARGAQVTAGEVDGAGDDRRQRWLVVRRRTGTVTFGHHRPQLFAQVIERGDQAAPLEGQLLQLTIDRAEVVEGVRPLLVENEAFAPMQPGLCPEEHVVAQPLRRHADAGRPGPRLTRRGACDRSRRGGRDGATWRRRRRVRIGRAASERGFRGLGRRFGSRFVSGVGGRFGRGVVEGRVHRRAPV